MLHLNDALMPAAIIAALEGQAALWWILSLWAFAVGGAIGSFMNVVVYRMPAGLSIVRPSSFCPHCKHPIRWWHNLPIVGWFMLRGKCYDCGAPIAPRYPLVEAIVAGLFLLLCHVEVFSGGANLPGLVVGAAELPLATLWATCGYHLLLCCTLLCIALVEFDGNQVPPRMWLPILFVGLIAPLALPALHQVPFYWPFARASTLDPTLVAALDGLCGLALAALLAWPTPRLARMTASTGTALRASMLLVGGLLGWQAVLVLANATMIVYLITTVLGQGVPALRRVPWSGTLTGLTVALIVFWKPLVDLIAAPG
jgi:leader peptidase (prepilin peptidase)/N-methyltransferase